MKDFEELKSQQLSYYNNVIKFESIIKEMSNSNIDLLNKSLESSSYIIEAEGLAKLLENPNISISVVAEVANGKSTFLNALIFKESMLHSGVGAVTARIFKVDYGEEYSIEIDKGRRTFSSSDALKEAVVKANEEIRDGMEDEERISKEVAQVNVTLPHEKLKEGITIYDTPGFGALDEELVYPIIQEAVAKSDAVILLIDIAAGLKRTEKEFAKDVLKSIPANKRFVVFNKIDAVFGPNQILIDGEEKIRRELVKVQKDTLEKLAAEAKISSNEIVSYALSAQPALAGYIKQDQSQVIESGFESFESDFWKRIVSSKEDVFQNRVATYNSLISSSLVTTGNVKNKIDENCAQLEKLKNALLEQRADFQAFATVSKKKLNQSYKQFNKDTELLMDLEGMIEQIEIILYKNIYRSLDSIDWLDKLKVWSLKDKYIAQIEDAINDSGSAIGQVIESEIFLATRALKDGQDTINKTIMSVNEKMSEFSDLGVGTLDKVEILTENSEGETVLNVDSDYAEYISIDKEIYVMIGGIVAEIIAGRLVLLVPGIGLAIAAAFAAIMKIWKTYNDPNKELAQKITDDVAAGLKSSIGDKIAMISRQSNEIRNLMSVTLMAAEKKLEMIENSFENPEEREDEIIKLEDEIKIVSSYLNQLNALKG